MFDTKCASQALEQSAQKQATQEAVDALAVEMKTKTVELEQAVEAKLSQQKQAFDPSLREQGEELGGRLAYESKSLRQELDVNSETLRLELQTSLEYKLCDQVTQPLEEIRQELKKIQDQNERRSALMEEQEERQVAVRTDLDRLRQDVSSNSGKLVQLADLKLQTEDQVRAHISELLIKAKADFQEQLQPFSPIERRLEQLKIEVSRHQTMAERAREELGGLLRAEMQHVAMEAASRQKILVDQELRSLLDLQQRQFTEALEAAASRASCELKELSAGHATEVRALALRLTDAERFSQQVGFAVREMQKLRVKALENGKKATSDIASNAAGSNGSASNEALRQLQQEMHSFARYTEAKTKELYQVLTELKATSGNHAKQLIDLTQEVMHQRHTALLLETSKAERVPEVEDSSPQWMEAVKEMETLTEIVGSLEREGPSSPNASITAVRRELQTELQQVWQALSELKTSGLKGGPGQGTKPSKAKMTPKAHPEASKQRSQKSAESESYSEESYSTEESKDQK
eukprot:s2530_g1.t1